MVGGVIRLKDREGDGGHNHRYSVGVGVAVEVWGTHMSSSQGMGE